MCLVVPRPAGFNNVDLCAANRLGVTVARAPASSHAIPSTRSRPRLCGDADLVTGSTARAGQADEWGRAAEDAAAALMEINDGSNVAV